MRINSEFATSGQKGKSSDDIRVFWILLYDEFDFDYDDG